jgi:hypothetical protein
MADGPAWTPQLLKWPQAAKERVKKSTKAVKRAMKSSPVHLTRGAQKELFKFAKVVRKADPADLIATANQISPPPSPWRSVRPSYLKSDTADDMRARVAKVGGQSPDMVTKSAADPELAALESFRTSYDPQLREVYFRAAAKSRGGDW